MIARLDLDASAILDDERTIAVEFVSASPSAEATQMTKLDKPLKRELLIDAKPYVLTIEPDRFKLVLKGHRKGLEFAWHDLVNGEAALSVALNASLKQPH